MKTMFDINLLNSFVVENCVELIGDYNKLTRDSIIKGKCKNNDCNNEFNKAFRTLFDNKSFYCKKCMTKIIVANAQQTNLKKYGNICCLKCPVFLDKMKKTNIEKYGVEFSLQNKNIQKKRTNTFITKYGGHPTQNINVKNKIKETNLKKYGVENVMFLDEFKNKIQETTIKKYGVENVMFLDEFKNKVKETNLNKYGIDCNLKLETCKEKIKQTCLIKYGVEYPNQNEEIMEKCSKKNYKLKEYTYPSGNVIKIQGYENYALDFLLQNENINEEDIVTGCKNVPTIWYMDENGKKHRHYVDIFIPSQKRCIEVKSTWTAQKKKDCIFLKQNAGKVMGHIYEIWVYNGKGNIIEKYL